MLSLLAAQYPKPDSAHWASRATAAILRPYCRASGGPSATGGRSAPPSLRLNPPRPVTPGLRNPAWSQATTLHGCGQGALLVEIRKRLGAEVIGFDLRPAPSDSPVPIIAGNAVTYRLPEADVTVCVVTAHHLSETELAGLIANVSRSCDRFILLDLVRHRVPLALFRISLAPAEAGQSQ